MPKDNDFAICQLYRSDPIAKALFDHLTKLKKKPRFTSLKNVLRLCRGLGTYPHLRPRVIALMGDLKSSDCGSFARRRGKHASRFEWAQGAIETIRAVAKKPDLSTGILPTQTPDVDTRGPKPWLYIDVGSQLIVRLPHGCFGSEITDLVSEIFGHGEH
jgi:hypothetical protein